LEKRYQWKKGELPAVELRKVEDDAIAETVKKAESIGMQSITDGEFRRDYFHLDFLQQLDGVTVTGAIAINPHAKAAEDGFTPPKLSVTGKLRHVKNIQVDDFNFLKLIICTPCLLR
jgi:5-methyltetrahydropteroyltriglutamate--homocysteine methyltransferase